MIPELAVDLTASARKALDLCVAVLSTQRNHNADPNEKALTAALAEAHTRAADQLSATIPQDNIPRSQFLSGALSNVVQKARESTLLFSASPESLSFLASLEALSADHASLAALTTSCTIQHTFARLVSAVTSFYTKYSSSEIRLPKLSLKLFPGSFNNAIPGLGIAFNASVAYDDLEGPDTPRRSTVKIWIATAELNFGCLPALPYVVAHELLCHWPQMLEVRGARPTPASIQSPTDTRALRREVDPIAEGWMDSLVPPLLQSLCSPSCRLCNEEASHAVAFHEARTKKNRKDAFVDAARIEPGAYAALLTKLLYEHHADEVTTLPYDDFLRLSCALNLSSMIFREREAASHAIVAACAFHLDRINRSASNSPEDPIITELLAFRRSHDTRRLIEALLND